MNENTELQTSNFSNKVISFGEGFSNLDEAMKFAEIISKTDFAPKQMKGKPFDILVAIQMGAEIGLKPMQSLQNIAVINGRPSIWGDAALALVKRHKDYEFCEEFFEKDDTIAVCKIKRKNEPLKIITFSVEDAKRAGLLNGDTNGFSPWKKYQKRMLQMRARGFALRDSFPDALHGLITGEEARDYKEDSDNIHSDYRENLSGGKIFESEQVIVDVKEEKEEENNSENFNDTNESDDNFDRARHSETLFEVEKLIEDKVVDASTVHEWLKKGKASSISELKSETLEGIIKKYSK